MRAEDYPFELLSFQIQPWKRRRNNNEGQRSLALTIERTLNWMDGKLLVSDHGAGFWLVDTWISHWKQTKPYRT